jgi:hypothetical protein
MTGMEWAVCDDPRQMVEALRRRGGVCDRQWRLFVAAFWRWRADSVGESRDELLESAEAMEYWADNERLPKGMRTTAAEEMIFFAADAHQAAYNTACFPFHGMRNRSLMASVQAELLREIFGNPFRIPEVDPRWRTSDVLGLARAIYDDRAFERMPILADALMDAGCEHEAIIGHCRGDVRHVRGCWMIDLLLTDGLKIRPTG